MTEKLTITDLREIHDQCVEINRKFDARVKAFAYLAMLPDFEKECLSAIQYLDDEGWFGGPAEAVETVAKLKEVFEL